MNIEEAKNVAEWIEKATNTNEFIHNCLLADAFVQLERGNLAVAKVRFRQVMVKMDDAYQLVRPPEFIVGPNEDIVPEKMV